MATGMYALFQQLVQAKSIFFLQRSPPSGMDTDVSVFPYLEQLSVGMTTVMYPLFEQLVAMIY